MSRSPVFVDRLTLAAWLAQQLPTLQVENLDQICTEERPPAPVKSRLPTDRPYIPLGEALSWLGFGVALQADDLYELLETGEIGDGVEWARDSIAQAMERLADAALAERVRCIGKHRTYSLFEETPLTEPVPPIKFADYRRFDPVYDGVFYGAGLHNIGDGSLLDGASSSSRTDHFASVQVHRGDLLAFFGKAAGATRTVSPQVAKPRVGDGTLLAWVERLGDDVRHSGQELLLARARQHFHFNRVTRDQIREMTRGRKRGPKAIKR